MIDAKTFMRRAEALRKAKGWSLSYLSRALFPQNSRALVRLDIAIKRKKGGPGLVDCQNALKRMEKLEREVFNGDHKGRRSC